MRRHWKVGDLAKLAGLTVRTLRFYDQIGLFSPSAQTESGHRLYNESDLSRLQQIVSLKELGLSLEEIKSVLNDGQISPLEIINLQMARIKEQMKLQQMLLEQLQHVSKSIQGNAPLAVEDFTELLQVMKKAMRHWLSSGGQGGSSVSICLAIFLPWEKKNQNLRRNNRD